MGGFFELDYKALYGLWASIGRITGYLRIQYDSKLPYKWPLKVWRVGIKYFDYPDQASPQSQQIWFHLGMFLNFG